MGRGGFLHPEELLSRYVQQKSITGQEKNAGEWIKKVCLDNGLHITDFGNNNGNYNFSASLFPLDGIKPCIVLLNHIDVVHEGDTSRWDYPPYSGHITSEEVWGRGSHDNKGLAIMQLFGLLEFKANFHHQDSKYNVAFLSVSCEETMCKGGVDYVIKHHLEQLNPVVVLGEGVTELNNIILSEKTHPLFGISREHKRPLWIELSLDVSSSGHGSVTPAEYANKAMVKALFNLLETETPFIYSYENKSILKSIGKHKSGLSALILKNPVLFKPLLKKQLKKQPEIYALFTNTVTLTSVNSGNGAVNQIPNFVTATLDCRLLPEYPSEKTLSFIRKALDNDSIKIKVLKSTLPNQISGMDNVFYQNLKTAIENTYFKAEVVPVILPIFNEIGKFRAEGIPGYGITPVQLETKHLHCIHAENERIPIEVLRKGSQVYFHFLQHSFHHAGK